MYILGISCYFHDAAAVLLRDGELVAAAEEERFSRKKHDSDFPYNAIDFCLDEGKIKQSELDYIVFYEKPFRKLQRILFSSLSTYPYSYRSFREAMRVWLTQKLWIKQKIASYTKINPERILFSDHHISHAASAYYSSPFKQAAVLTVDGIGEWATVATGIGTENKLHMIKEIRYPHSLGLLYSAFTAFLGFEVNEGEWKVMGLAPYGKPRYTDKVQKLITLCKDGSFTLDLSYFSYQYSDHRAFTDKFVHLFGEPISPGIAHHITNKAADIAASIQVVMEEALLNIAQALHRETGLPHLCLAGGVVHNSVANFRLLKDSGFKNIFIQPAAGDSGGALGGALYVHHHVLNQKKRFPLTHAYWGESYTNREIETFLKGQKADYMFLKKNQLIDMVSTEIQSGKVVGWMQDKFEWGARALGARSILADARNPKMKDIVNSKVKFREAFRPFAPSVLSEKASDIFDLPHNYREHQPLRYMLYVVPVKRIWQKKVPAITHADYSARPQLVDIKTNPLYYQLIKRFYQKTGVPLILNTSFNLKGEPIVATPADAYSTFMRSGIDILVMGNFVCKKA